MRRHVTTALLFVLLIAAAAGAKDDEGFLHPRKVRLGLPTIRDGARPRHSARIAATLEGKLTFDPERDDVQALVGSVTVFASEPGSTTWRSKGDGRWVARLPGARLCLNVRTGDLKLTARRLDLSEVESAGPMAVPLLVRIGDLSFTVDVDFAVKRRRWRYAPSDLTLLLETGGGFTGDGDRDYHLVGGRLTVHDPYRGPSRRTAALSAAQRQALREAAEAVSWGSVPATYLLPGEDCCCDQIVTDFQVRLARPGGGSVRAKTLWCSMSIDGGDLPDALVGFLEVLEEIGEQVLPGE
jgi:hypothetical protein